MIKNSYSTIFFLRGNFKDLFSFIEMFDRVNEYPRIKDLDDKTTDHVYALIEQADIVTEYLDNNSKTRRIKPNIRALKHKHAIKNIFIHD